VLCTLNSEQRAVVGGVRVFLGGVHSVHKMRVKKHWEKKVFENFFLERNFWVILCTLSSTVGKKWLDCMWELIVLVLECT